MERELAPIEEEEEIVKGASEYREVDAKANKGEDRVSGDRRGFCPLSASQIS